MIKKSWMWLGILVIGGVLLGVLFKILPKVHNNKAYAMGVAQILKPEENVEGGKVFYFYSYQYEASESTAVNDLGAPIKGPIIQSTLSQRKPKYPQNVRIQYMKEEPTIFEILEPLSFEDE
jgi:hypothetical protein